MLSRRTGRSAAAANASAEPTSIARDDEPIDSIGSFIASQVSRRESLYSQGMPPAGHAVITVLAGAKLPCTEGRWVALCGGCTAETGAPTHYLEAADRDQGAPRGAPSWSGQPMKVECLDVTADLILLLCENMPDGSRRCVGRAVLPLSDLLPLNPCGAQPAPNMQLWICLLYTSPSPRDRQKSRMPSSA